MVSTNKRLIAILMAVPFMLLIPFIAMQFTSEVKWDFRDFVMAGFLLTGLGLGLEFILRKFTTTKTRLLFCLVLFTVFFLIWAELAVGIFGTPFAGS